MNYSTCPIANVNAPIERIWQLLADPNQYALWWDARTRSIIPAGPVQLSQHILAQASALGRSWDVHITVQAVMPEKHQLDLLTRLP